MTPKPDHAIQVPGGTSCRAPAAFEIHPSGGHFEDYTHACAEHVGALIGHFDDQPDPTHYEIREVTDEERARGWYCCHVAPPPAATVQPTADPFDPRPSPALAAMTPAEVTLGNATRALFLELPGEIATTVKALIGDVLRDARIVRAGFARQTFTIRQEFPLKGAPWPPPSMSLGAAVTDPRVLAGGFWVYARDFEDDGRRFSAWHFRVVGDQVEARFYNPDRESADGIAIGWRPWRPAPTFGLVQLRQPVTIIEPTEAAP